MSKNLFYEGYYGLLIIIIIFLNIMYINISAQSNDEITIHNKSELDLYGGIYYHKSDYELTGEIKHIEAGQSAQFLVPKLKLFYFRDFLFSFNKSDLKNKLSEEQVKLIDKINIGTLTGNNFYIALNKGYLKAYNKAEWLILKPALDKLNKLGNFFGDKLKNMLKRRYSVEPYSKLEAGVRLSSDLSQGEKEYLKFRDKETANILKIILDKKTKNKFPRIALCTSGGGYRAMISTLGFLQGLEKINVLQASTYISTLSGSTWLVAPWVTSGISLAQFQGLLMEEVNKNFYRNLDQSDINNLIEMAMEKSSFNQPFNSVTNIYSILLNNALLKNIKQLFKDKTELYLSDQISKIKDGKQIFPIYTAILPIQPYKWFEYTPYEIGTADFGIGGAYIPSWALNREFLNGKAINFAPPETLSSLMATWGSAYGINAEEFVDHLLASGTLDPFLYDKIKKNIRNIKINGVRIFAPEFLNYVYGINNSLLKIRTPIIELADAGIDFNLPIVPLLRKERAINVIIIFDASANGISEGSELKKIQKWAASKNIKLPNIDFASITDSCSIFSDPNPEIPTIIYLPFIKNNNNSFDPNSCLNSWCSTFNFEYSREQTKQIVDFVKSTVIDNRDKIINGIKSKNL